MADEKAMTMTLVGAAIAVAGYAGKSVIAWWKGREKERAKTIAQLEALQWLLHASGALFIIQQDQVKRLMKSLEANHPAQFAGGGGYEEVMMRCHPEMNAEELALHGVIHAYTEHSLRKVNQAVSDWLRADSTFKTGVVACKRRRELAQELFALEIHLLLWHAKFESWIPGHPERALVYLADEKAQGLGFPGKRETERAGSKVVVPGVEVEVTLALDELRAKWR